MLHRSIKAVLFDYGGVLAEEGFRNGLVTMAREQGLDVDAMPGNAMNAVYDSGFVLGHGTEKDFWAVMRERTGLNGSDEELTQRILDGFVLRPWMIKLVQQLRDRGYITGILSDQTNWLDWLNELHRFYDVFDHIYNSFYMGKGKQDPTLFDDIANKLDLPPDAILFVDDNAGNVKRAAQAGWRTIHYVGKDSFLEDIAPLLR